VRQALFDGQVIAVPGHGGYELAATATRDHAEQRLAALSPTAAEEEPDHFVVGHRDQAGALSSEWSEEARRLAERCWPGPLTLLACRAGGRDTILVSMATTRDLRRICRETGPWCIVPTGQASAEAVRDHFTEMDVALVFDGGSSAGPGATVMDCTVSPPRLHREGALPANFIEAALLMAARRRWRFRISNRPSAL
jgi:tRNA A37 threonylcarbamoyladenosine synthetase subunit TsaC/SUA5/YrdC